MGRPASFEVSIPRFILEGEPNCATTDPELFYAQESYAPGSLMPHAAAYYDERAAKQICKACPLIMQCLEFAISNHELGIWGGTTERDRQRLRSSMRRAPLAQTRSKL